MRRSRDGRAEPDADHTAGPGEQHRLGEELAADVAAVAPSARRRPISLRRSITAMTITLAMPMPPTSSATAPSPRNSDVNACWPRPRAASASDGRQTSTSSGVSRVDGRRQHGAHSVDGAVGGADVDRLGDDVVADQVRLGRVDADDRRPVEPSAAVIGSRMPMTANHCPPMQTRSSSATSVMPEPSRPPPNRARQPGRCSVAASSHAPSASVPRSVVEQSRCRRRRPRCRRSCRPRWGRSDGRWRRRWRSS